MLLFMKKQPLTCCLLVITSYCFSQDKIVTLRKDTIDASIIKNGRHTIVYSMPGDSSGRQYRIDKRQVHTIVEQTGTAGPDPQSFRERVRTRVRRPPFEPGNNLLAAGFKRFGVDEGISAVYLSYERRFLYNRLSAAVAPHAGIGRSSFGGAVSLRYTPHPYTRVNFLIGTDLFLWSQDQLYREQLVLTEKYVARSVTERITRGGFLFVTGCKINTGNHWVLIPELSAGVPLGDDRSSVWKDGVEYHRERSFAELIWQAQIAVGYRF
ncbi:hypothetical protein [Niabella beijingensis]|uniref:hypothetical protein n=1 Tax=Niabella beijingensis TaxID=2872700 RepID=UPI001CBF3961|nr:hypothetical protein [Niabella beijingensis]MBZ4188744.1 hypothetical protein [Niabella beijingensis]